ncbi:S8 family serine peptidase [Streptomyces sp. NBC_01789]|uniref:S8 family serine peptidase n=1 Tax=Streptomyces sp. NBC_01789 TaxID=2975941 RepID=UPI002251335C|nr:S8 family serine peptidase [Streptomyces sp. NBC_01789]MCX4451333.1 S8 family serine peptidase [Streptomyces sp. NBC_01789]
MRSIPRRRYLPAATALTMALIGWGSVTAPAADAGPAAGAGASAPAGKSYDITLVTGDLVHYTDLPGNHDVVTVDPAEDGSAGVEVQTRGDDTYVIPRQAMSLLAAGKLDERLFNVTGLVAMGYDDAHTDTVPVIASAPAAARSAKTKAAAPATPKGAESVRTLSSIHAKALRAEKGRATSFWKGIAPGSDPKSLSGGIGKLWLDGKVEASLATETAQIKATDAWQQGLDGTGVKVAVLDTGADLDHPDLVGQVDATASFVPGQSVDDGNGHGTHTASTIAGTGAASGGKEKGAAPGARLLVGKVLGNEGTGEESYSIAGMEWAKAQGADIVSMSLGTPDGSDGTDPTSQAVNELSADGGPLFVIAAGNAYDPGSIGSPGAAASALTVAAVDKNDERAEFSSQGPLIRTHSLKPDVSAPGVDVSAAASQSVPGWTGGLYRTMSGTSMATPLVAGSAAILKERHPDWSGERIKNALMSTSDKTAETPYAVGTGRVNVASAVSSTIEATGSVEAAAYDWPNADAKTETRTVAYRNDGDADVTLALALDADADAYTLSQSSVTVPAHGTATVTLTLDPSKVPAGTTFSGHVVAKDTATGQAVAHTGFALFKEAEMYDYTIKLTGRDGKPLSGKVALHTSDSSESSLIAVDGEKTLRLPPGRYTTTAYVEVPGDTADSLGQALLISDEATLGEGHASGTADLDATKVRKAYAVPERESEETQAVFNLQRTYDDGAGVNWSTSWILAAKYDSLYLAPTEKVSDGSLRAFLHWRLRQKALDAETGSGRDIELTAQPNTAYHDGSSTLRTVYAGRGTAADYTGLDVRGKAVIVDRTDDVTAAERAQAAADGGATLLVVVNNTPGRLYQSYAGADGLTVASVRQGDGARLVSEAKSGKGRLRVKQQQYPDYSYDLVQQFKDVIPDKSLAYKPDDRDLARVNNSVYAAPGTLGYGGRYFIPAWGAGLGGDAYEKWSRTTTEYVTGDTSAVGFWYEQHTGLGAADGYFERGSTDSYAAGRRYDGGWFKPVQAARLGDTYVPYQTSSNALNWNVAMWSGGDDGHVGAGGGTKQTTLYRGDTQLVTSKAQSGRASNMTAGSYRLVATGQRTTAAWPGTTSTSTTWGFDYKPLPTGTARANVPMLNLDYDVDTDLQGTAKAGKRLTLGLHSATYDGATAATSATLQVSYDDGATWQDAKLKRAGDDSWTTVLNTPRDAKSVSLRATAGAPGGLTIGQDVIRAITLK